ncbi:DUF58 domain-containing protein [Duganella qianjiadongensis]|uniref:DUF58 domain-containing protein n=1 Tax=Duganella qianjiadongensis TaxID=2692176 RepID=A0ABW9VQV2_9BURK|nr:DUF58 domain-containing protein [Duganella qianjiadongensis]MYM40097.1 DUF58 domain-containing protein [Duganella qianjiadongensis]
MAAFLQQIRHAARARWLYHLGGAASRRMTLGMRRIYIVPTRAGLQCALLLLVMLLGSLNYNLALGYALTFLLGACVLADMVATARNLAGLQLAPVQAPPVFAGAAAGFRIELVPAAARQHYAVWLGFQTDGAPMQYCDVGTPATGAATDQAIAGSTSIVLHAATTARGWQDAGRIRLVTRFPLGLFRAWSYWQPDLRVLVYPAPEPAAPPLPGSAGGERHSQNQAGSEHYTGVRDYRPGDSPRQLAWRQIARQADTPGRPLLAKQFEGGNTSQLAFDLAALPPQLTLEHKLSRLCAWVLAAETAALPYSLQLDERHLAAARGPAQQAACLQALALYGADIGATTERSA